MQESDSKKLNLRKLRLIPNSEVRAIIAAVRDVVGKTGTRTLLADTVLRISHAYVDLSGAYKDTKRALSELEHTQESKSGVLESLIVRLENHVAEGTPAKSAADYETEIAELRRQNAGLARRAIELEHTNANLSVKLTTKRKLAAVTGTPVHAVSSEEYDGREDLQSSRAQHQNELVRQHARDVEKRSTKKKAVLRVRHSSQTWRPAKPNREEARQAASMKQQVLNEGDAGTADILALLGE